MGLVMNPAILLVDDEKSVCSALKRTFRNSKFNVFEANNGKQALDVLQKNTIDVVLSDQRMPGMSGTQLLTIVKNRYPSVGRIILSGQSDVNDLTDAINEANIYKFLPKPWNDQYLLETVNNAIPKKIPNRIARERSQPTPLFKNSQNKAITAEITDAFFKQQLDLEHAIKSNSLELREAIYKSKQEAELHYLTISWPKFSRFKHEGITNIAYQSGYLHDLFTWYLLNTINHLEENDYNAKAVVIDLFSESFIGNKSLKTLLQSLKSQKADLVFRIPFSFLKMNNFTEFLTQIYQENSNLLLNLDKRVIDINELELTPISYVEMSGKSTSIKNHLLTEKRLKMVNDAQNIAIKTILSREQGHLEHDYINSMGFDFF